nr:hypothetical protein [Tanacetum cinerariifolium]
MSELSGEGHSLLSSRIILSKDDYDRGCRKPSDLEDGFYRDTIKLGPEYLTGMDDEEKVTNKNYFVTFINYALRFCYVYLLHTKDEALDKFKVFNIEVNLQQWSLIKRFRTDRKVPRPSLSIPKGTEDIVGSVVPKKVTEEVCKVIKSLYELKQTPKQWHQKFDEVVLSTGYLLNQADKCAYSKFDDSGKGVIICLYVDDMLIFGTDQSHYIEKVRKKYNYFDSTPVRTLISTSDKMMPNNGQAVSQLEYSRVIGCLMYVMTCTRPGITFVVGKLSRYTVLEGYIDASWISNTEGNSSTSGWVFLLSGGIISWASKKQFSIIGSTMECEFVALAAAGKEAEGAILYGVLHLVDMDGEGSENTWLMMRMSIMRRQDGKGKYTGPSQKDDAYTFVCSIYFCDASKRYHIVPYEELNGILVALVARGAILYGVLHLVDMDGEGSENTWLMMRMSIMRRQDGKGKYTGPSQKDDAYTFVCSIYFCDASKRYHIVPYEELNGILVALVARFRVIFKSTNRIRVSLGG